MPPHTRTKFKIQSDRVVIAKLYLEGWWQKQIADTLGLSQEMVSYDIKAIEKQWRDLPQAEINELRNKQLSKIDIIEREYWEAWHDSKKPKNTTSTSKKGDLVSVAKRNEPRNGNPQFLQGIERCIAERNKMLGLYAATKSELTGVDGSPIQAGLSTVTIDAIKFQVLGIQTQPPECSL